MVFDRDDDGAPFGPRVERGHGLDEGLTAETGPTLTAKVAHELRVELVSTG